MPKNKRPKKDESSSDSDSGPEDRGPAEKKLASSSSTSKSKKNADGEISFQLDKTKFVKVREFKGKILIDIREFYEKDGEYHPGRKGIALNASCYQKLKELLPQIDEALEQF